MKEFLKRFSFYGELRYVYRAFFVFGHGFSYLWHRFGVGPRIRNVKHALDRPVETREYSVHVLCSHDHLTMLLWMLASWYNVLPQGRAGQVYIHEDGSFEKSDYKVVRRLLPSAQVVRADESHQKAADVWLSGYPAARELRLHKNAVFSIKLIDSYFVSSAPHRFLFDADILWFKAPAELLGCVLEENSSVMMEGQRDMNFSFPDGTLLPKKVRTMNAGIIGYPSSHYQPSVLEEFCCRAQNKSDFYFIEQAGHAFILRDTLQGLPEEYHIKGPAGPHTVAKHFTGPRREMFWFEGVQELKKKVL